MIIWMTVYDYTAWMNGHFWPCIGTAKKIHLYNYIIIARING